MDRTQTIVFAAAMVFLAVRLYQKYIKKKDTGSGSKPDTPDAKGSSSAAKDDDYEPYSNKRE